MSDRTVSTAAQARADIDNGNVHNPFRMGAATTQSGGALVSVEQQRAIAEVQARMIIARANPRDPIRCMDLILQDCTRPTLAETALYQYARGGTSISGPSIRLAESIARRWGNIASGIKEISREDGYSECVAYAWDLETGYYDERQFQIRHWRDTKSGGYKITDERDIYELLANMGQRRKRAVLLTVMPGDVVEAAVEQCEKTLHTSADTSPEALKKVAEAFSAFGVTQEQIEKRCQCRLEAIRAGQVVQLRKIYASLKDGMSAPVDWFEGAPSAASVVAAADADKGKPKTDRAKAAADKEKPTTDKPITGGPAQDPAGDRQPARETGAASGGGAARQPATPAAPDADHDGGHQGSGVTSPGREGPGTAFFPTDDTGEPFEIPGGAEAFDKPSDFAGWLATMMKVTARPEALWENNSDALSELKASWPDLWRLADDAYADAQYRVKQGAATVDADDDASQAPDAASGPENGPGEGDGIPPVKVPTTPAGKLSSIGYAKACRMELDHLTTQAEVTAWVNRNFATYQGRAIEAAIEKHIRETRARIGGGAGAETQQQPAQDRDAVTAEDYLAEIKAMATLDAGKTFAARGDVVAKMSRWERERPELHQRVTEAAAAKMAELKGAR